MGAHIGIIGAGQVGAAAGYLLSATPGISSIVLVDQNEARAAGEAADIGHAAAFGNAARVREGGYADLAGAAVVVITAGVDVQGDRLEAGPDVRRADRGDPSPEAGIRPGPGSCRRGPLALIPLAFARWRRLPRLAVFPHPCAPPW